MNTTVQRVSILPQRRNLSAACLAHMLHDGCTDLLYALLPVWQIQFGLSYAGLAIMRALYYCTMGGLQFPGHKLMASAGPRKALAISTLIAASGFVMMAIPLGLPGLCIGLVIAGIGSSVQHPCASLLVTQSYGKDARKPLGIYNFAGDLGKSTFPAVVALMLPVIAWRPIVGIVALVGILVALALWVMLSEQPFTISGENHATSKESSQSGFGILLIIGALDTSTRMGYLLFLPFLL
jgi:FSR family fosmidomycin resistance protein-like MFS transporter